MTHWSWDAPTTVVEFKAKLAQAVLNSKVVYAEPNYIFHEAAILPVNYTLDQILSFPVGSQTQTTVNIQQSQLWNRLTIGKVKPIIAIIDTGINTTHTTFTTSGALWENLAEKTGS